jgi:uncharacterized membrane protein
MADIDVTSTLSGESTSVISGVFIGVGVTPYQGESVFGATITWVSAPNAPTRTPATNTAYNLQQFIDSLGTSRSSSRIEVVSSPMVNSAPPKKAPSPR